MKSGCFKLFVGIISAISAILTGLVFLGMLMGPEESIDSLLKKLPASELAAIEAVCKAADIEPKQLRPLGVTNDALLRDERNARSVVIRDGHVRVLCLRDFKAARLPDINAWTEIEALWLERGKLASWPALASLTKLTDLQLNDQPLGSPPSNNLPPSLKRLGLAGTKVTGIDTLTHLALDELNLARTPIKALPSTVPAAGRWSLNLDDTAVTHPPGYQTQLPAGTTVSGPTLVGGKTEGTAGHKRVNIRVTGAELKSRTTFALPTNTTLYHTSGPVEIGGRVATGTVRVWMQEPDGFFDGPWFKAGKITGFGLVRPSGFVTADIGAGGGAKARGALIVQGTPPHFSFAIVVEPVGDAPVTGIDLQIRTAP